MMFRFRPCFAVLLMAVTAGCSLTAGKSAAPTSPLDSTAAPTPGAAPVSGAPAGSGAATAPADGSAKPAPRAPDQPASPARVYKPLTPEGAALFKQIQDLDRAIPAHFSNLKRSPEEIYNDILSCVELCKRFLVQNGESAEACDARACQARLQLAGLARYFDELRRDKSLSDAERTTRYQNRMEESLALAEKTAGECSGKARLVALQTCVDLYDKLTRYDKLRATADTIYKEYPDYVGRQDLHVTYAQSYLSERRCVDAAKYLQEIIKEHSNDSDYVLYNERLFDALTCLGDLEGMEELKQLVLVEYPTRLPSIPDDDELKPQYEQAICVAPFWIGFVRMALGDNAGAREWFNKQIAAANVRAKLLKDVGKGAQNDVCNIYSNFRSHELLNWIDTLSGKVPECEFDLGEMWASEKHLSLKESKGKVVAVLFRLPENVRASAFLQQLDSLVKEHEKDGLVGIALGFLTGAEDRTRDAMAVQKMRDDMKKLNVSLPAGFDPDRKHKIFSCLRGTVGTASFALIDRQGRLAWWLADPRDLDREILRRVVERLLKEKP